MSQTAFKLESLLETHDLPFVVIDANLRIVAVNRAWEHSFSVNRQSLIGHSCCIDNSDCRHRRLFHNLEPYANSFIDSESGKPVNARGFPLLDADATLYLGETLSVLKTSPATSGEFPKMIGKSAVFSQFKARLEQAAETKASVVLFGETGTGKELAAEFLHLSSEQATGEFVIFDCAAIGDELFESELFGHEVSGFAEVTVKQGLMELANNGTLVFDEISELALSQQAKLLRALENGHYRRVGGTTTLKSQIRVICTTHRNLADMVQTGRLREDLFYRLSVIPIEVPALRERRQDIPLLIDYFLAQLGNPNQEDSHYTITQEALIKLIQHTWPGNIRELRNCLQLAASVCDDKRIEETDIHFLKRQHSQSLAIKTFDDKTQHFSLNSVAEFEAEFINSLIQKYQGNRKLIAAEMNISERTLYRKLSRLNLN